MLNALAFLTMRPINMREDCFRSLIALISAGWPLWLTGEQKTSLIRDLARPGFDRVKPKILNWDTT